MHIPAVFAMIAVWQVSALVYPMGSLSVDHQILEVTELLLTVFTLEALLYVRYVLLFYVGYVARKDFVLVEEVFGFCLETAFITVKFFCLITNVFFFPVSFKSIFS